MQNTTGIIKFMHFRHTFPRGLNPRVHTHLQNKALMHRFTTLPRLEMVTFRGLKSVLYVYPCA